MRKLFFFTFTVLLIFTATNPASAEEPQTVYTRGDNDELPEGYTHALFNGGGLLDFKVWVAENLQVPENPDRDTSGRVIVSFVINEAGNITEMEALVSPDELFSKAVIQTMASSAGKWTPGINPEGETVRIRYLLVVEIVHHEPLYDGMRELPKGFNHATFNNGGPKEFREWIKTNMEYSGDYFCETLGLNQVFVAFIIGIEGNMEEVEFLSSPDDNLSLAIFNAMVASSQMWKPATDQKGKPVRIMYNLKISFESNKIPDGYTLAQFKKGGLETFRSWVQSKLTYPPYLAELGIRGKVLSTFVINEKGKVSDIQVLYSPHQLFSEEVINVLRSSTAWSPAKDPDGKPVKVRFSMPVDFQL